MCMCGNFALSQISHDITICLRLDVTCKEMLQVLANNNNRSVLQRNFALSQIPGFI